MFCLDESISIITHISYIQYHITLFRFLQKNPQRLIRAQNCHQLIEAVREKQVR